MKKFIEKITKFLWDSSADPSAISLTIKGIILRVVTEIIKTLTDAGIATNEATVTAFVIKGLAIFSTAMIVVGLIRKAYVFLNDDEVIIDVKEISGEGITVSNPLDLPSSKKLAVRLMSDKKKVKKPVKKTSERTKKSTK